MTDVASASVAPAQLVQPDSRRACDTDARFADCLAGLMKAHGFFSPQWNRAVDEATASSMPIQPTTAGGVAESISTVAEAMSAGTTVQTSQTPGQVLSAPAPARIYPSHWFGNGYLSLGADETKQVLESLPAGRQAPIGQRSNHITIDLTNRMEHERAATWVRGAEAACCLAVLPPLPENTSERGTEALSRTVGLSIVGDLAWALRRVRLANQSDGVTTAWLRDFTLKPTEVGRAIESVMHQARYDGLQLERIVVNGREVWRSNTCKGEA